MNRRFLITLLLVWSLGPLLWQVYTSFCSDQALVSNHSLQLSDQRWTLIHYQKRISPPILHFGGISFNSLNRRNMLLHVLCLAN